jgi:hypothetical protein
MQRQIPGLLWIAIVSLGLMVVGKVMAAARFGPVILVDAAISALILYGIIRGYKWAYVLTIVSVVLGVGSGLFKGMGYALVILMADGLVWVPVLLCTDYFFPQKNSASET